MTILEETAPFDPLLMAALAIPRPEVIQSARHPAEADWTARAAEPAQHWYVYYRPDPHVSTEIKRLRVKQAWLQSFAAIRWEFDNLDIVTIYHGKELD